MDWLTFERLGCHFVKAAPSTAERGNWPGWYSSGEETGRHCAMFPGIVVMLAMLRFCSVSVPSGGSWYVVELSFPICTGIEIFAYFLLASM